MIKAALRKISVLRVAAVPDNRTGGMSRTMHCTGDSLIKSGHAVEYLFEDGLKTPVPRQLHRFVRPWEVAFLIRRRLAANQKWDVVEIHEPLAVGYGMARRFDPTMPPLVVFSYGIETRGLQAMLEYHNEKKVPLARKSKATGAALAWQAMAGIKLASHTVCSNRQDVDYLATEKKIPYSKLTQHHSGVEQVFIDSGAEVNNRSMKGLLFVGSWIERKGILDLVPAVEKALKTHPDAHLTVAGCNCPAEVVFSAFSESIRKQVRVIPHISDLQSLTQVYAQHAIMLIPSYFEGHPLVMVEAAAMGLAIITTPVCGMLDFITDDVSGKFTPVGNSVALASNLNNLLANPDHVKRLGLAAREVAAAHSWESAAQKIEACYRSVITP
jgi:glycosyltransferase involved in cell wall biosynthesis